MAANVGNPPTAQEKEEQMPQFVFTYRAPKGYTANFEKADAWRAWFDSMGDQLVQLGNPIWDRGTIGDTASETTQLGGFSIVSADDLDSALAIAKGCPQVDIGGGVEVGLLAEVPGAASAS
jgi:hypothetical protein